MTEGGRDGRSSYPISSLFSSPLSQALMIFFADSCFHLGWGRKGSEFRGARIMLNRYENGTLVFVFVADEMRGK